MSPSEWIALASLIVALVAVWFTIQESRRNNSVVLYVRECTASGHQKLGENSNRPFIEFRILIENCGISLHKVRVWLKFDSAGEFRNLSLELGPGDIEPPTKEFAKGMIAEFKLKSYKFEKRNGKRFIDSLVKPVAQRATITVYSQEYLAATIPAHTVSERAKVWWNGIAARINRRLAWTSKSRSGEIAIHEHNLAPKLTTILGPLESFVAMHKQESDYQETVERLAAATAGQPPPTTENPAA